MPIKVECPHCHKSIRVPDDYAGRKGKCPSCRAVLRVPSGAPAPRRAAQNSLDNPPPAQRRKNTLPAGMPPIPPPYEELDDEADDSRDYSEASAPPPNRARHPHSARKHTKHRAGTGRPPSGTAAFDEDRPVARGPLVVLPMKSVGISIILTVLFGPLGLFYSTVTGGLIMTLILILVQLFVFIVSLVTLGFGSLLTFITLPIIWSIGILWGAIAANSYNKNLERGSY